MGNHSNTMYPRDEVVRLQEQLDKKYDELTRVQLDILEIYYKQWDMVINSNWFAGKPDDKSWGNAYGLRVDDMHIFQLDGILPRIERPIRKHNYKHYSTFRQFINARLSNVCSQLKPKAYDVPVAIVVVHYYNGNRLFDVDNREKEIIINTLKRHLYRDDTCNRLTFFAEKSIKTSDEPRTMIYVGPEKEVISMIEKTIFDYPQIDCMDGVFESNYPLLYMAGYRQKRMENENKKEYEEYKKKRTFVDDKDFI